MSLEWIKLASNWQVSAPPGYSEHHTGYAVDIGDTEHPDTYLQQGAVNSWLALQINLHQVPCLVLTFYIYKADKI